MKDKRSCVIIGAAPCDSLDFIDREILDTSFVFAADGGYLTAIRENISVDAFIGDMDSSGVSPSCTDCTILPCEKDYGDVHTAVLRAIEEGFDKIYLIGCSNGRADHYFANVALLELISNHGIEAVLCDKGNQIRFISQGVHEYKKCAKYLSLLSLDEKLCGVTLKGLKYPLNDAVLRRDMPIGLSNEWAEDIAIIEIKEGRALLIFSEDDKI